MSFEVYRKRGRHWQYLGTYSGVDSRSAALQAGYVHHCRVLGVRPEGSLAKLFVYRFGFYPELHHGR